MTRRPRRAAPMRLFVYEHTCSLPQGSLPASLHAEGRAMRDAVLADLADLAGVYPVTMLGPGVVPPAARCDVRPVSPGGVLETLVDLARHCQGTLLIAPESGGCLHDCCTRVRRARAQLLGPGPRAVALTADKHRLARRLARHRIPTPPTRTWHPGLPPPWPGPLVLKPVDGAGSEATFLAERPEALAGLLARAAAEGFSGEMIVQPFARGRPVSVAFLLGPAACLPLAPCEQVLSEDGRFRYRGGRLPLPPMLARRAVRLATRAVAVVPGLRGYVGVDLVLGERAADDRVIEINPRLTTSYVGLRAATGVNLAGLMLRALAGEPLQPVPWRPETVAFAADGTVTR